MLRVAYNFKVVSFNFCFINFPISLQTYISEDIYQVDCIHTKAIKRWLILTCFTMKISHIGRNKCKHHVMRSRWGDFENLEDQR